MEKLGDYHFQVLEDVSGRGFCYKIYDDHGRAFRESKEFFQYKGIARFAAIGHISLLEQGKG